MNRTIFAIGFRERTFVVDPDSRASPIADLRAWLAMRGVEGVEKMTRKELEAAVRERMP